MKFIELKIVPEILSQSCDKLGIKLRFIFSFFIHYTSKMFGKPINLFPKMNIKIGNIKFETRENTIDFWMLSNSYEKKIMSELNRIKERGTFIDVGANIGRYTVVMAERGWKVHSFEPIKDNFRMLRKHLSINKLDKMACTYNIGLGEIESHKKIYFKKYKHGEGSLIFKDENSNEEIINIRKLDNLNFKKIKKPLVLKIDVEGYEYQVLKGAIKFIKNNKPLIIIEVWDKDKDYKLLNSLGYKQKGEFWKYEKD